MKRALHGIREALRLHPILGLMVAPAITAFVISIIVMLTIGPEAFLLISPIYVCAAVFAAGGLEALVLTGKEWGWFEKFCFGGISAYFGVFIMVTIAVILLIA